jgi:hypothetical protein
VQVRKLFMTVAALALGGWSFAAAAQQNPTDKSDPAQAVQQGSQDCTAGMIRDANGNCVQSTGDMPATQHQQELLKGESGEKEQQKSQ